MRRWNHSHSILSGAAVGLTLAHHGWVIFLAGAAAGVLALVALRGVRRVGRLAHALERRVTAAETHPCRQCGAPIDGRSRAGYCSPVCRGIAAELRGKRERTAERLEALGDVIPWDAA